MIADFFVNLTNNLLIELPVLAIPIGIDEAFDLVASLVGYINIFVPLARVAPILALIVMIRNYSIMVALFRFVLRFIPFVG